MVCFCISSLLFPFIGQVCIWISTAVLNRHSVATPGRPWLSCRRDVQSAVNPSLWECCQASLTVEWTWQVACCSCAGKCRTKHSSVCQVEEMLKNNSASHRLPSGLLIWPARICRYLWLSNKCKRSVPAVWHSQVDSHQAHRAPSSQILPVVRRCMLHAFESFKEPIAKAVSWHSKRYFLLTKEIALECQGFGGWQQILIGASRHRRLCESLITGSSYA